MASQIVDEILSTLDELVGGVHPGSRPVHAHGIMAAGTFASTPAAVALTRALHAARATTGVTVRFSIASGIPTAAENDPAASSPQGIAIRFHLDEHVHTDIIAHSHNGFPVHTPEEFLEFFQALVASTPDSSVPSPITRFLDSHPAAKAFIEAPKPIPASFAKQAYFAVTAFKFTNVDGVSQFGRFRIEPVAGTEFLTPEQLAGKNARFLDNELSERLAKEPVQFRIWVQLAEPGDVVTKSTVIWPATRAEIEFGTITLTGRVDERSADHRKIIFDPVPRIDGIDSAGDPLTAVRSEIYLLSGRRRRKTSHS
jgi:catalase